MAWMEAAGSIIGQLMANGKMAEVGRLRQEAMARYGNTNLSTLEALVREQLGPSKIGGVQMDQKYKSAQDSALDKLMGIANADGMDAQSMAKLNDAKQAAFGVERGMRGAAEQGLARRGQWNSGAAVSSALGAAQGGADRAYQGSVASASDASQRALEALMAGGRMASGLGQNDLAQKNLAAGSEDRIAQFNLGHKTDGEQALIDAKLRLANAQNGVGDQQAGDIANQATRDANLARGVGKAAGTAWDYSQNSAGAYDPATGKLKKNPNDPTWSGDEHNGQDW